MRRLQQLGVNDAFLAVTSLFLGWGVIAATNEPLMVALRSAFALNYTQGLTIQLVSFAAFGLLSLPAAALCDRLGAVNTILSGLATMLAGCLAIRFTLPLGSYGAVLAALFVQAAGINLLQVAANPLVAALGPQGSSHFRLSFAQAFNSLGVVLGTHYATRLMLGDRAMIASQGNLSGAAQRGDVLLAVGHAYVLLAIFLMLLAGFVLANRRRIVAAAISLPPRERGSVFAALKSPWVRFGALAIGLYVGAEVSIGAMMIAFLNQLSVMNLPLETGGEYLANLYWGGALVGRFIGSALLTRVPAPRMLGGCAAAAALCCLIAFGAEGPVAGYAALGIGLFNSIMFPTIFTLTFERSGTSQAAASGLLCVAIAGGGLLPFLVGRLADLVNLAAAFVVPACAYVCIIIFAFAAMRPRSAQRPPEHKPKAEDPMALTPNVTSAGAGQPAEPENNAPGLRMFVMALFFIFGGITSLNDVIIPKLKELFTLNYTQAMLVQFCFFTAYAVIGIPGARLVKRIGYMRGAVAGLLTMMTGCLLFIPASQTATYGVFLLALFVLASGVVIVQVVSNPLISMLGKPETAHSRLTFAQAFNSLGTTVFPVAGAAVILGGLASVSATQLSGAELDAYRTAESQAIVVGYLGIAAALAVVAGVVWMFRNALQGERHEESTGLAGLDLLRRPRFGLGALSIFLYVGAEVSIGSLIVSYLRQDTVMGLAQQDAGKLIGLYWGGAMVGRFIGSAALRLVSPGKVLAAVSVGAIALIGLSTQTTGTLSGYSLLAVGLMNAIMFPTIFSLACEKLGPRAADGSGIINVAIFGGAVIPLLTGVIADASGSLAASLVLPALCYAVIAVFGWYARRPA